VLIDAVKLEVHDQPVGRSVHRVNGCFVVLGSNVAVSDADRATAAAHCNSDRARPRAAVQAVLGQLQVPAVACGAECSWSACLIDAGKLLSLSMLASPLMQ
jgi:hypothetical protein